MRRSLQGLGTKEGYRRGDGEEEEREGDWREGLDFNPDEDAAIDTAKYYVGFFASVAFFDFISPLASEP